jgi:hypothetical protein
MENIILKKTIVMGKKILKWVVIIGGIGLFIYILLFITSIYKMNRYNLLIDKSSSAGYEVSNSGTLINKKIDSTLFEISKTHSHLTTSQQSFDSLTFGYEGGDGFSNNVMHVSKMYTLASFYNRKAIISSNYEFRSFLKLPWLTLKTLTLEKGFPMLPLEAYHYYVENGKSYLSHTYLKKTENHNQLLNGDYKQVDFFINIDRQKLKGFFPNYDDLNIYIPLENMNVYKFLKYFNIVYSLFSLFLYLFLIWKSGGVLLAISNNKSFEWKNVKRLKQCLWTLLILIFLPFILMLNLYLGFYNILHGYVQMKSWMELINWKLWIMLIIYFSLFLAFFRGNKLQTDQEYTI